MTPHGTSKVCRRANDMTMSSQHKATDLSASPSCSAFKIVYGRGRFPIQQKRPDGTLGCRGCGGEIPKGRKSWCSRECYDTFDPARVVAKAKQRDKEICCICGYNRKDAYAEYLKRCFDNKCHSNSAYARVRMQYPAPIEYDHIKPFSEGGLTVLENIRSLCSECHKRRTKHWHKERGQKAQNQPELFQPNSVIDRPPR